MVISVVTLFAVVRSVLSVINSDVLYSVVSVNVSESVVTISVILSVVLCFGISGKTSVVVSGNDG